MKKRLIIELEEEAFRSILGALLRTSADFTVESIGEQEKPVKTIQKRTAEGKSTDEVLLEVIAVRHKLHRSELPVIGRNHGFAMKTLWNTANKLAAAGKIRKEGEYYFSKMTQGA